VWFDETHMKGNILDAMSKGIETADVVLVFVTRNYVSKVASGDGTDNVRREFLFASSSAPQKLVPIRFDADLPRVWGGPVGMVLGSHLYVDMATDETSDRCIDALVSACRHASGTTLWKMAKGVTRARIPKPSHPPPRPSLPSPDLVVDARRTPTTVRERVARALKEMGDEPTPNERVGRVLDRLVLTLVGTVDEHLPLVEKIRLVEEQLGLA